MPVREAMTTDYEVIRDLLHASDALHARHVPAVARVPDKPRFTRAELAELVANERCLLLVGEQAGVVVGFIEASVRVPERPDEADERWCGITNLAVEPRWQRHGLGTLLVSAVEGWARSQGIDQVRLDVFAFNDAAQALYAGLGYHAIALHLGKSLTDEAAR